MGVALLACVLCARVRRERQTFFCESEREERRDRLHSRCFEREKRNRKKRPGEDTPPSSLARTHTDAQERIPLLPSSPPARRARVALTEHTRPFFCARNSVNEKQLSLHMPPSSASTREAAPLPPPPASHQCLPTRFGVVKHTAGGGGGVGGGENGGPAGGAGSGGKRRRGSGVVSTIFRFEEDQQGDGGMFQCVLEPVGRRSFPWHGRQRHVHGGVASHTTLSHFFHTRPLISPTTSAPPRPGRPPASAP